MSSEPEEKRFARQDSRRYSGWSSVFTLAVIVMRNVRFWHKADIRIALNDVRYRG
jgi:hypothetical protein